MAFPAFPWPIPCLLFAIAEDQHNWHLPRVPCHGLHSRYFSFLAVSWILGLCLWPGLSVWNQKPPVLVSTQTMTLWCPHQDSCLLFALARLQCSHFASILHSTLTTCLRVPPRSKLVEFGTPAPLIHHTRSTISQQWGPPEGQSQLPGVFPFSQEVKNAIAACALLQHHSPTPVPSSSVLSSPHHSSCACFVVAVQWVSFSVSLPGHACNDIWNCPCQRLSA